jgi:uncharacterized protein (DUF58 family)
MDWGRPNKLRYSKRLAALLGALALLQSDSVRVFALGDGAALPGAPLYGPGALQSLVAQLEMLPVATRTDLRDSLYAARQASDLYGVVVLLSDFWVPAEQQDALATLRSERTVVTALHVVDPAEALPRETGALALHDRESEEQLLVTLTPALRRRYVERFAARAQALAEYCASLDIRYVRVPTEVSPLDVLMGIFRAAGAPQ